jgi:hypothetical protein
VGQSGAPVRVRRWYNTKVGTSSCRSRSVVELAA